MNRLKHVGMLLLLFTEASCQDSLAHEPILFEVTRGSLVYETSLFGELVARESVPIHAPEVSRMWSYTIESVLPDGTKVSKGDIVLTFDQNEAKQNLQDEQLDLLVAKAELRREQVRLDKDRTELDLQVKRCQLMLERAKLKVVASGRLVAKLDQQQAELDVARAQLDLKQAQATLKDHTKKRKAALDVLRVKLDTLQLKVDERKKALTTMSLKAPAAGMVYAPYTRLNWEHAKAEPGRVVHRGDKVLEIPNMSAFDAHLYVRQREAMLLKGGDQAQIVATVLPSQPIIGHVTKKESFASTRNERKGTKTPSGNLKEVRVVVELEKSHELLRPGGSVQASISSVIAETGPPGSPGVAERNQDRSASHPGGWITTRHQSGPGLDDSRRGISWTQRRGPTSF